ncbi:RNA polymerase sigma factor, sigma-70 family [Ruminococcaceae bacterium FB2012]|nr:RNA polymerase sigma factor, sigma-70 family [Ruminococcaceae bacterium FB2012]
MEKTLADKLIFEYRDRIFGFALEKTRNIDRARELASDIMFEVYRAFLRHEDIVNTDGYVYRISKNVWAKYVHTLETGRRFEDISNMEIAAPEDNSEEEEHIRQLLRREIGFLSERQRTVIYMFYYDKRSVAEIAKRLGISEGTVKWHLSDARTKLKEGIDMNIDKNLELNPIHFEEMGHSGYTGSRGDTADIFDSVLKMNIAWACYHEPKTFEEIAREVGVPQVYAADQLAALVDFGFIDKLDNSKDPKYRTNMLMEDLRYEGNEEGEKILCDAAAVLAEKYFPKIFADFEASPDRWGMTCDGDDINFMKYSLVMLGIRKLRIKSVDDSKFAVERPDGGCFVAYAVVSDSGFKPKENKYWACGDMTRDSTEGEPSENYMELSVDCAYAGRQGRWRDNLSSDWSSLTKFINRGKGSLAPEEYKRLSDKGYIFEDRAQPIVVRTAADKFENILYTYPHDKITVPEEIKKLCGEVDAKFAAYNIKRHPKHMHGLVKAWNTNVLGAMTMLPRVIEIMLRNGQLAPLTDIQKKSVFSVLFLQKAE